MFCMPCVRLDYSPRDLEITEYGSHKRFAQGQGGGAMPDTMPEEHKKMYGIADTPIRTHFEIHTA